jgi:hypothetical protein
MAEEKYPINIWVNEERYEKLKSAGLWLESYTGLYQRCSKR